MRALTRKRLARRMESEFHMALLTDALVFGFPKKLRRCSRGHCWYSTGKFFISWGVYSTSEVDSLAPDKKIVSKDLCPYCMMTALNELSGDVEVITEVSKSPEDT